MGKKGGKPLSKKAKKAQARMLKAAKERGEDPAALAKAEAEAAAKAAEEAAAAAAAAAALEVDTGKREEDADVEAGSALSTLLAGMSVTTSEAKRLHSNVKDIHISNLNVGLHGHELLVETDLTLSWGRRYGLIGPNGCGKSTLLTIIGRRMVPIADNIDCFHVVQEVDPSELTALEAVLSVDEEKARLESEADRLSDLMAETEDPEIQGQISEAVSEIYERLDEMDAETAEARAAKILWGLGFTVETMGKKTKDFSGGWRMRISLARALFINPSLLLLDEPTNHLDMESVVWLENYLATFSKILFIISHSQDFMNNVCTNIVHMQNKKLVVYGGNYDTYRQIRAEKEEHQMKRYNWEQEQIRHMKDYIARFGHGSAKLAKQAQSKEKTLAKMERAGLTEKVHQEITLEMKFPDCGKIPPPVLQIQDLTFSYPGGEKLYKNVDFGIDLDSRIALVGANGAGKSTLLKLITGQLIPTAGNIRPHPHLRMSMYTQHFVDTLDLTQNPLDYLRSLYPDESVENCRSFLGRFGVTGRFQTTIIDHLSDGLKSRVVFAIMAHENPHMLLLDEPTNHLDIETIDALAKALNSFTGGVVLVSHDMRLISQVAREIYEVQNQDIQRFRGDIMKYKEKLKRHMEKVAAKQEALGWGTAATRGEGDASSKRPVEKTKKDKKKKKKDGPKPVDPPAVPKWTPKSKPAAGAGTGKSSGWTSGGSDSWR